MKSGSPNRLFGNNFIDLVNKISINSIDNNGQTLLHHAIKLHKIDYVELLLSLGINNDTLDHYKDTPLQLAIKEHFVQGVQALIKSTAYVTPDSTKEKNNLEYKYNTERRKRTYAESQMQEMKRDLASKNITIREKQYIIDDLQYKLAKTLSPFHKNQLSELTKDNCRLKDHVNTLENDLTREKIKRSQMESKYNIVLNEVESLKTKVPKLEAELTKVVDERNTFKKRYEKLREGMKK
uniref:Uncharacterized protein n=1 Tax=viral metagenome TaxID=1070528 RepID=A0A6C0AC85_9ZZZZ